jgi:hypothetical protein
MNFTKQAKFQKFHINESDSESYEEGEDILSSSDEGDQDAMDVENNQMSTEMKDFSVVNMSTINHDHVGTQRRQTMRKEEKKQVVAEVVKFENPAAAALA